MRSSGPVLRLVSSRLAVGAGAGAKRRIMNGAERTLKRSTMGAWASRAIAGAAVVLMSGCSLSVDANRKQCKVDGDCLDRGPDFEGSVCRDSLCQPPPPPATWLCLDNPPPAAAPAGTVKIKVRTTEIADSGVPVRGATVKICRGIDALCEPPQFASITTDEDGRAEFDVPANFTGYLDFGKTGYHSTLYFFNPVPRQDFEIASVQMAATGLIGVLASVAGVVPEPVGHGVVLLNAFDCLNQAAPGVKFTTPNASDKTVTFYASGPRPVTNLPATEVAGYGGFLNVPAQTGDVGASSITVQAHLLDTNQLISNLSIYVRPNTISVARMLHDG